MFDIQFENDEFLVINKHPGVSVHKDDGDTMLVEEVAKASQSTKLYLVHRLDKMTSGILLLAKNATTAASLSQLFADKNIEKFYLAIGDKKPKKKQGLISGDMERSRRSMWKLMPTKMNPATTQFFSKAGDNGERVFLCRPLTGKTHQIRVALKSLGSAILGDPIYHSSSASDRGYLHAFAIRFELSGVPYEFVCDPRINPIFGAKWHTETIGQVIDGWSTPWALLWPKK
ncbi:TIGR01621 family pseudouridine synthase [Vibrio sp. 10N.261.51.F12]|uniref:TIGR01621 family pseudouridine synthase n=1 Tax=Vibrio sp. 10N.261.51.F12 TaxID=3229679 RepID=UPI00354EF60E